MIDSCYVTVIAALSLFSPVASLLTQTKAANCTSFEDIYSVSQLELRNNLCVFVVRFSASIETNILGEISEKNSFDFFRGSLAEKLFPQLC